MFGEGERTVLAVIAVHGPKLPKPCDLPEKTRNRCGPVFTLWNSSSYCGYVYAHITALLHPPLSTMASRVRTQQQLGLSKQAMRQQKAFIKV